MPRQKQPIHKFFFQTIEENFTQIVVQVIVGAFILGGYVAITRIDHANIASRVSALEEDRYSRELISEKFDSLNKRIDGLVTMIQNNSNKIDNLKDKFFTR